MASLLLRRELELGLALVHLLHVHARLVAVEDRRHHHAAAARVEQRHDARLAARTSRRRRRSGPARCRPRSRRCAARPPPSARRAASAVSSTQSRSCTKASWSAAAWATRSALPSPSTVRWAARSRRSLHASTIAQTSATTADAGGGQRDDALRGGQLVHAAVSVAPDARRAQLREDRPSRSATLLSVFSSPGHRLDLHLIGTFWPVGGCSVERDRDGLGLAGGDRVDRLLELDRVVALAHRDRHVHVGLGVLALVLHLDLEGEVAAERDGGASRRA